MRTYRQTLLYDLTTFVTFLAGEARVLNGITFAVSEKGFETNVNTDSRMLARHWIVLGMWLRLTDNESIPVPISAMHKMYGLGYALDGTMQLDLEGFPNLRRDMQ